ncbi:uncharacterized protein K452DRAFT_319381 [Aplosporella prunicola CBS 121167]|uniref:Uncharacterized protein n=1 Tax=Aplosporella prunicola CBS 121167 TaxID=1176127 RepID=A0A6A6BCY6_9PEZI|nr:uncharacterized protein K452DRAFT_319381 [Aplosporella prunicola CBS 121167]KAF2141155.1 hypothetical protein K452DRAFT_319381 [Aplosporella prunicola CBS 121167]
MADAWAEEALALLLEGRISPQQTAEAVASAYDARLKSGNTDTCELWSTYGGAIDTLGTSSRALDLLADTIVALSALPDVRDAAGVPIEENGRVFWRHVPETSFWMGEMFAPLAPRDIHCDNFEEQMLSLTRATDFGARCLSALDRAPPPPDGHQPQGPRNGLRSLAIEALFEACEDQPDGGEFAVLLARMRVPVAAR